MNETKPLNVPLIVFTFLIVAFLSAMDELMEPEYFSAGGAAFGGFILILISPILILWFKALWNSVVPRVTNWREVSFWEATGLFTLILFLFG